MEFRVAGRKGRLKTMPAHDRVAESRKASTPAGRLMFTMMAAIAAFERDLIVERTKAGMAAARNKGIRPGPRTVMNPEKVEAARDMLAAGQPAATVCKTIGVSRATLYRHLAKTT